MYNLRTELIKSILSSLKIDDNPFNQQIIKDKIEHIEDQQLQIFYGKLFDASHQYINGIDRVAKVAEAFKPIVEDPNKEEAKRLIKLVESINAQVYKDSEAMSIPFSDLVDKINFKGMKISEEDLKVFDLVKPYCSRNALVSKINEFENSEKQIKEFINALKYPTNETLAISGGVQKMLKGSK